MVVEVSIRAVVVVDGEAVVVVMRDVVVDVSALLPSLQAATSRANTIAAISLWLSFMLVPLGLLTWYPI